MLARKCKVSGCKSPEHAREFCYKHYQRWMDHGELEPVRLKGRGDREKHPLYTTWCSIRRSRAEQLCDEWGNDFWAFVDGVKERPTGVLHPSVQPIDTDKKVGPDNWYWRIPEDPIKAGEKRRYMRKWSAIKRKKDPNYWKSQGLKRHYGATFDWYEKKLKEQNGVCAICHQPETKFINGNLLSLAVDHCHNTDTLRGLLCMNCNRGIGHLKHDITILKAAIAYLTTEYQHV